MEQQHKERCPKSNAFNYNEDSCETCLEQCKLHPKKIQKATESLANADEFAEITTLFKSIADETRLKIISGLIDNEMCVCDIASFINMTISAVSHQLRILKAAKVIKSRKSGKNVYYSIDDWHISALFSATLEHIREKR
jgi:DNA-binding transcriptional ArsR family regulator